MTMIYLFCSSLLGVLCVPWTLICISFLKLEKISCINMFTIASVPLNYVTFPSSISFFLDFAFSSCPRFSGWFMPEEFYCKKFLTDTSTLSIVPSLPYILFSLSCIMLVKLPSVVSLGFPKFFISIFASFCIFFIDPISTLSFWVVWFISFQSSFAFLRIILRYFFISSLITAIITIKFG